MAKKFSGIPKLSDFAIEEQLLALKGRELLYKAEWLSVDPYQRLYTGQHEDGTPMIGYQVAEVVESKDKNFPVGSRVIGRLGWRTLTVTKSGDVDVVLDLAGLPLSAAVGLLGMPGYTILGFSTKRRREKIVWKAIMTAYFGLIDCCQPKAGETLIVNAAAGAVGSTVEQITKILGCRVIGYAGDDDKLKWLKNELGFDHVFNYKKVHLDESLKEAAPHGIDCFFDNVGGTFAVTVYKHMNHYSRICQCGSISGYNNEVTMMPEFFRTFMSKGLTLKGFDVSNTARRWPEAIKIMGE